MSNINLWNEDCLSAMRRMEDSQFQLAIVDPPYGESCNISSGGGSHTKSLVKFHQAYKEMGKSWNQVPGDEYFKELFRVSVNQIVWGGNYFNLPPCRCFVAWDKIRTVTNFSQVEFAWTSFQSPALIFRYCNNAGFILSKEERLRISPSQKPVQLYKWLLKNYAKPGDRILDTHCGSGSILLACDIMGYDIDAYEIDLEYYTAAKARLIRHQSQGTLFTADGRDIA